MPTDLIDPIGADEFTQLLKKYLTPFPDPDLFHMAVAVSGGPDSMALALCAHRLFPQTFAFIVDHGLRAESASEALEVKGRLEELGIQTEILRWDHEPIAARLHEQAREARYDLLFEACRRRGIHHLMVAHHREDQAETILMRVAKGSGVEGLAGMSPQSIRGGLTLLRPFLSISKQRLIATCETANVPFVTDPSNISQKFARGRLRKIMPLLEEEGLSIDSLLMLGARASEAREALDFYAKNLLRLSAECEVGGSIRLARKALCEAPRAVGLRALALCLRYVHDGGYPPEYASLSALLDTIADKAVETSRSFYGCLASIAEEKVSILREPSAADETLPLESGQTILWDKRWLVHAPKDGGQSYKVRALGNPPHDILDRLAPELRHLVPQGRVRASLPALWVGDSLTVIPSFDEKTAFRLTYQKQSFP